MSLIELSVDRGDLILVNTEHILYVTEETPTIRASVVMRDSTRINVRETYQEIKKRCGLSITPRAETIALR